MKTFHNNYINVIKTNKKKIQQKQIKNKQKTNKILDCPFVKTKVFTLVVVVVVAVAVVVIIDPEN